MHPRVCLIPIIDSLLCIIQIHLRLPTILRIWVPLPLHQPQTTLLLPFTHYLRIYNHLHHILLFIVYHLYRRWSWRLLVLKGGWMVGCEQLLIEDIVDFPGIRNLQTICGGANLFDHLERTIASLIESQQGMSRLQVGALYVAKRAKKLQSRCMLHIWHCKSCKPHRVGNRTSRD